MQERTYDKDLKHLVLRILGHPGGRRLAVRSRRSRGPFRMSSAAHIHNDKIRMRVCTHKSSSRVRFRAKQTLQLTCRMTESDPLRKSATRITVAHNVPLVSAVW
jgi:hypothetical protein